MLKIKLFVFATFAAFVVLSILAFRKAQAERRRTPPTRPRQ
ncbi:MAG TPA: hypothetical protein VGD81_19090 [Opitutaceae bacterium]